jgi:hypothetical protein
MPSITVTTVDTTTTPPQFQTVSHVEIGVTYEIPGSWTPTPNGSGASWAEDGATGFVLAYPGGMRPLTLAGMCDLQAHHIRRPFGTRPLVTYGSIDGRRACLVTPSPDALPQSRRADGPSFRASLAVMAFLTPVEVAGESYSYLLLETDTDHFRSITASLRFGGGH